MTTERLTDEQIAELARQTARITSAPWRAEREPPPVGNQWFDGLPPHSFPVESTGTAFALGVAVAATPCRPEAEWIAAARNALPSLLAEVRESRARAPSPSVEALARQWDANAEAARDALRHVPEMSEASRAREETIIRCGTDHAAALRAALVAAPSSAPPDAAGLREAAALVVEEVRAIGQAWRDDWSDFDGRTLKSQLFAATEPLRAALAPASGSDTEAGEGGGRGE